MVGTLEGVCGGVALVTLSGLPAQTLFDAAMPRARIRWANVDWDALHSLSVWRHANDAIVRGDWSAANDAKSEVEEQQRRRAAAGGHTPRFFVYDSERRAWRPVVRILGEILK